MSILTLDAGTSGLKCSLFRHDGTLLMAAVREYETLYPREGMAEQRAEDILRAAEEAIISLCAQADLSDVCAIGLTGTMNGVIPIDESGNALYNNIIHLDTRATEEVSLLEARMGREAFYRATGNRPDVHYGLPKLMWLKKHAPDVYRRAHSFVNTKDALYGHLTGKYARSDYSDASLFGAMNIHRKCWDEDVCRAAGIDKERLPELRPSTDVSARLLPDVAARVGLKPGIPVAIGAGDGPCSTHGSGVYSENGAYLTIGSSAWVCALSKAPVIDPAMRAFNYTDMDERLTNVCGTVQCASTALDYLLKTVAHLTDERGAIDFARAEAMARLSPPGANGLFFLSTLMGERCPWWDANGRGALIGMTLTHTREDIVRAGYEGVAQALNNCADVLRENGIGFSSLVLSGGGVKSAVWPQMLADIIGVPAHIHAHPREATSMGAMMAAGVGAGVFASFAEAAKTVSISRSFQPDTQAENAYKAHTRVYRQLYPMLANAMHAAAEYQALKMDTPSALKG